MAIIVQTKNHMLKAYQTANGESLSVFSVAHVSHSGPYTLSEHITLIWDWVWFKSFDVD